VGLKPILRNTTSFSALTLLVGSFDPQKPSREMTYNVFSGTLNPTHFTSLVCFDTVGWAVRRASSCLGNVSKMTYIVSSRM